MFLRGLVIRSSGLICSKGRRLDLFLGRLVIRFNGPHLFKGSAAGFVSRRAGYSFHRSSFVPTVLICSKGRRLNLFLGGLVIRFNGPHLFKGHETPETKESQWDSKASLVVTAEMEGQLKNGGFSPNWMVTVPRMVMVLMHGDPITHFTFFLIHIMFQPF